MKRRCTDDGTSSDPTTQYSTTKMEVEKTISKKLEGAYLSMISIFLCAFEIERVHFNCELKRIPKEENDEGHDIILTISCNQHSLDPHWRCDFSANAEAKVFDSDSTSKTFEQRFYGQNEQSMKAGANNKSIDIPILRINDNITCDGYVEITIKLTSWYGFYSQMIYSFENKVDNFTDAILIIEDRQLYVNRPILSLMSEFFNKLFHSKGFKDSEKNEFDLSAYGIAYDEMVLFLESIYPEPMTGFGNRRLGEDELEILLKLADQFLCSKVKPILEKYLMGEKTVIEMSPSRRLFLCDRYRFSAPLNQALEGLEESGILVEIQASDEFKEMSEELRAIINTKKDLQENRFIENLKSVKEAIRTSEMGENIVKKLEIALGSLLSNTPDKNWKFREWGNLCATLNQLAVLLQAGTRDLDACVIAAVAFLDVANTIVVEFNMLVW